MIDRVHCSGCRDDYYNDGNGPGGKVCWSRETAVLVLKRKVHVSQSPPWTNTPKQYPNCYRAPQYVMVKATQV